MQRLYDSGNTPASRWRISFVDRFGKKRRPTNARTSAMPNHRRNGRVNNTPPHRELHIDTVSTLRSLAVPCVHCKMFAEEPTLSLSLFLTLCLSAFHRIVQVTTTIQVNVLRCRWKCKTDPIIWLVFIIRRMLLLGFIHHLLDRTHAVNACNVAAVCVCVCKCTASHAVTAATAHAQHSPQWKM